MSSNIYSKDDNIRYIVHRNRFIPVNEEDLQRGHQKENLKVGVWEAVEEVEVEAVDVEEYGEAAAEKNCDDC